MSWWILYCSSSLHSSCCSTARYMRARWRAREVVGNMLHMSAAAPEHSPLELYRLLSNMIRTGRVEQVCVGAPGNPAACRVRTGDLLTTWVPWMVQAAGGNEQTRHWRTPAKNEPCLLFAPGGDLAQAVALPGIFSSDMPQGAADEDVERHDFSSTDYWEHRRSAGTLVFDIGSAIDFKVGPSSLRITPSSIELISNSFTHNGKNVGDDHTHGGIAPGLASTGVPD